MATTPKNIQFNTDARSSVIEGARILKTAVGSTLGPKGRNVTLKSQYGGVKTVHDGVTVANEIKLKDPALDAGATLLRDAARKANDTSGDGTTTATVLAYEIAKVGNEHITAGINPMLMVEGIAKAGRLIVEELKKMTEPIEGDLEKMIQVATISAANQEIGEKIAGALEKVGEYGVVTADSGSEQGYTVEYKEGMEWDKGWVHPAFVLQVLNGKPNIKMESQITNPSILITDHTITSQDEIIPLLQKLKGANLKNLVVISDGLEREALAVLAINFEKGAFNICAVPAPSLGQHKRDGLADIAILTGGKFISQEMKMKLEDVELSDLGRADLVTATIESTTIIGGKGEIKSIKERAEQLAEQLKAEKHEYIQEKIKERLAKLTAGVAVVKVGMPSDAERDEKIERVRDAIGATRAAVEKGIIPGGGVPLLVLGDRLEIPKDLLPEEVVGFTILKKALASLVLLLANNAGVSGEVVSSEILKRNSKATNTHDLIGYDVIHNEYVDLKKAGIIDPVKVTIAAVENAISVASNILTTETLITDEVEEKKKQE